MPATSPLMNVMIKAAEKAGRSLVRDFGEVEQLQVSKKGPGNFVTAADKRAEEILFEELKKARPDYSFLMEESGEIKGDNSDHVWIIDPLDGTHNFMHGIPHWCISIALQVKGRIEVGLVHDPVKDETFKAERSGGAFMGGKRMRVSGRSGMESAMIGFGSENFDPQAVELAVKELDAVKQTNAFTRRLGAAALDLCYVAAGRFEGFWERGLKPWDIAAGAIILKESGGFISSIDNNDDVVFSRNLVSGNADIYPKLKKILQDAKK